MIVDKNRIFDGWLSLEGGVDAGRHPSIIDPNQAVSAENMTFRGGDCVARPGFRKLDESFPDIVNGQVFCYGHDHGNGAFHRVGEYAAPGVVPFPPPSYFEGQNSETIYRTGIMQCATAFNPHGKEDCIVALIGGRLFKIIPGKEDARVSEIVISDPSSPYPAKVSYRNKQDIPLAYMVQADKWLLAQDGNSRCVIYDGVTARRSNDVGTVDNTEIPTGTIMAYGMGRVVVIVNDRDIAFGDLFGSHDTEDPADSLILFTERNFLAEGFDAQIPAQNGVATGMAFFPQLDTSTGNGQLLVFSERGASSFFMSLPREEWKTSQFQIFALLTTGMRGHRSLDVVNEDLWFRSEDGTRSYRQARSEASGWAHIPLSTNVRQFLDTDPKRFLKFASSVYFDNRFIMSCSPYWNHGRPLHDGTVVVDFDILSAFGTRYKPAWEGHWTLPGTKISQVLTGTFNGVPRTFVFGVDPSGNNQLYELSKDDTCDWDAQHIEWELVSRMFDFTKLSQQSNPFTESEVYDADLWVREIKTCGSKPVPPGPAPTGACCLPGNNCVVMTEAACLDAGGTYMGDNVPCTPNPCGSPPPPDSGRFYRILTIPASVVQANQVDFPVWVKLTDPTFQSVPSGGHVRSSSGFDVLFWRNFDGVGTFTNEMKWEVERYGPATGDIWAHVKLPFVSSVTDTVFYMTYGDPAVTTDHSDPHNVWTNGFLSVYHLGKGITPDYTDSTVRDFTANPSNGPTGVLGQIYGATHFDRASEQWLDIADVTHPISITGEICLSCWVKMTSFPTAPPLDNAVQALICKETFFGDRCDWYFNLFNDSATAAVYLRVGTIVYPGNPINIFQAQWDITGHWTVGTWHLVHGLYDGTAWRIYFDGEVKATLVAAQGAQSTSFGLSSGSVAAQTALFIDRRELDGSLDECRVANTGRSPGWVKTEYNNQFSPATFVLMSAEFTY